MIEQDGYNIPNQNYKQLILQYSDNNRAVLLSRKPRPVRCDVSR